MDRLWFHQIVFFSECTASVSPKDVEVALLISESLSFPSLLPPPDELLENSTKEPLSPESQVSSKTVSQNMQDDSNKVGLRGRPKTVNLSRNSVRLHSSSSSTPNGHMQFRKLATARRLQKSMSYRTQGELELEEVKGFIDLGFIFKKENVSARMMNVVPGLQRLSMHRNKADKELIDASKEVEDDSFEKEEDKSNVGITRPYLSEAWLIKRPDSQLLNLKIPRLCSAADMKKHLRFWAKTVAFEIDQE
ncbi:uncharacterized protein LOC129307051 [Prosopis cineraria]|uniref:uncharacterized protein LOC129307051 n=1 Tax=Prosopis cineraria TaxID=364024 RepID=UPI00240FAC87|nr:uncharacterized protein LOC129307051 [Prosopis cineraria]